MNPDIRDALLSAVHMIALERFKQFQADTGHNDVEFYPFRAGYQNAVIDMLSGVFGRGAVVPGDDSVRLP